MTLERDERLRAVIAPFVQLEGQLQARRGAPHFDRVSAVGLVLILLGFIGAIVAGSALPHTGLPWLGYLATAVGLVVEIWGFATAPRRQALGAGLDALAGGLRRLQVTEREVLEAHALCARQDLLVAQLLPVELVVGRLQRPSGARPN